MPTKKVTRKAEEKGHRLGLEKKDPFVLKNKISIAGGDWTSLCWQSILSTTTTEEATSTAQRDGDMRGKEICLNGRLPFGGTCSIPKLA